MIFVIHWHESAMELHVFPIPIPPPTSLSTRSLWVFPVHQVQALVSCIQPGLMICFTLVNIHVSMLFSWNIPPLPSPTESKVCSIHLCLFFWSWRWTGRPGVLWFMGLQRVGDDWVTELNWTEIKKRLKLSKWINLVLTVKLTCRREEKRNK